MHKALLYLILLLTIPITTSASVNYDSLRVVLETSTNKKDFEFADSLIQNLKSEYSGHSLQRLIYTASARTRELKFEYLNGRSVFRESIINTIRGDLGTGMKLAKEALLIFSRQNSIESARCYNTMGSMVATQGDTETGISYLKQAFKITELFSEHSMYRYLMCDNHLVMGYIYILAEDYETAEFHLKKALDLALEVDYVSSQTYSYLNFAKINRERENYDVALKEVETAMEIAEVKDQFHLKAVSLTHYADVYYDMGEIDSALHYYMKAEEIGIEHSLSRRLIGIYKKIISIHTLRNDYESTAIYQKKYIDIFSEVKETERKESQLMLETQFKVGEKNNRIKELAYEKEHQQERNQLLQIVTSITIAAFILLVVVIFLIFSRNRLNRKMQAEMQEKTLSKYKLTALKSQMNPHFIFNALNSIQDLILKNKTEASYTYITKFSELVRGTLNHSNENFIDFDEEMAAIRLYLELERLRFPEDLTTQIETNDIGDIRIPPLLIQPFVENSIKHGLLHKSGEKVLKIKFELDRNVLTCIITDNGIGREESAKIKERRLKNHFSFATKSIENRFELLRKLYGNNLGISYTDHKNEMTGEGTGTTVRLSIPFEKRF